MSAVARRPKLGFIAPRLWWELGRKFLTPVGEETLAESRESITVLVVEKRDSIVTYKRFWWRND